MTPKSPAPPTPLEPNIGEPGFFLRLKPLIESLMAGRDEKGCLLLTRKMQPTQFEPNIGEPGFLLRLKPLVESLMAGRDEKGCLLLTEKNVDRRR